MNDIPCGKCLRFDPILGPNEKATRRGQCIPRSKYPYREGPGQVFPPGVERVGPMEPARPYIVRKEQVVAMCAFAKRVDYDLAEEKKKKQVAVTTRKDGKRVHT